MLPSVQATAGAGGTVVAVGMVLEAVAPALGVVAPPDGVLLVVVVTAFSAETELRDA